MKEISIADRANFAVAKEAGQGQRTETALDHSRVVTGITKQVGTAPITAAEAATVNRRAFQLFVRPGEEREHVFVGGGGIAPLELHGLSGARQCADGDNARVRVRADEVSDEEITTVKIIEIFVN